MSSQFPDSIDSFTDKTDNVDVIQASDINNLQDSIIRIENTINPVIKDDDDLLCLCHYEEKTSGYRSLTANESGAVRYEDGKYEESVHVERGTKNYVKNPALRLSDDLWEFVENEGSMSCNRVSSDSPPGIDTTYCLSVEVESDGDVDGSLKTVMEGLTANTPYAISFWVKNVVSGSSFTGKDMRIAFNDGSGVSGSSYSVTSDWNRASGDYTTASDQDSFVLEVWFDKSGADDGDQILLCGFQVESGSAYSSYCDGDQGTGYAWTGGNNSSSSIRNDTIIQYPISTSSGVYLNSDVGSIGFWLNPDWGNSDSSIHYFFDTSSSSSKKRISIYKDTGDKLNFKILEPDSEYSSIITDEAVDWEPENDWMQLTCTYNFSDESDIWTLQAFIDGQPANTSSSGAASTSSAPGDYMYLGSSYDGEYFADGKFDDFSIYKKVLTATEVQKTYDSPIRMSEGILRATSGSATTHASIGTEKAIAHELGEIPSFIEITEKGPGVVYLSSNNTNEYFYVKSTASSVDFDWRAWK